MKRTALLHSLAYCFLLLVAGNETTRNAITGGMVALMSNPGERKRLREDPALLETAADEVVRWTSPVIYFLRTTADEVAWVDANLQGFKGRVSRDRWVEQARTLASGGETEFSKRVEDGDVY